MDQCEVCVGGTTDFTACQQDCTGVWGGSPVYDLCGVCDGDDTSCADCTGTPNGLAQLDECGACDTDSSNDCVQDCLGEWGGSAVYDLCGVCDGDDSSCSDCNNVPYRTAYVDQCDVCVGGTTDITA